MRSNTCVMQRNPVQPAAALPTSGMDHKSATHCKDVAMEEEERGNGEMSEDEVSSKLLVSSISSSKIDGSQLPCSGGTQAKVGFAAVGLVVTAALFYVIQPVIEGARAAGTAFTPATTDHGWHQHPMERSVACSDDSEASSMTSALLSSRMLYDSLAKSRFGCKAIISAWVRSNAEERMMLVGPFVSEAMEWQWIDFPFDLLEAGERVRGFTGDTVSADDWHTPIAYPPLHMHHIHVMRETSHWFETHGDYHMDPFEGYHLKLPGDLCVVHDGAPLRVQAHVNDVRFASVHGNAGMGAASTVKLAPSSRWMQWNANPRKFSSLRLVVPSATGCHVPQCNSQLSVAQLSEARRSSRPYSWYLRIRMQLVVETLSSSRDAGDSSSSIENHLGHQQIHDVPSPTCERVDKFVMFYPRDYAAMHDALQRYNAGNTTNVMFWSIRPTAGGTLIPDAVRFHSHRGRFAGLILVRGEHTVQSLIFQHTSEEKVASRIFGAAGSSACLGKACTALADVRQALIEAAGDELLCHDDPTVPSFVDFAGGGRRTGAPPLSSSASANEMRGRFDRSGSIICQPFEFHRGEPLTLFSFSAPNTDPGKEVFLQHTLLLGYYKPNYEELAQNESEDENRFVDGRRNAFSRAFDWYPPQWGVLDLSKKLYREKIGCGTSWEAVEDVIVCERTKAALSSGADDGPYDKASKVYFTGVDAAQTQSVGEHGLSGCNVWCQNPCHELNGDVQFECGGCKSGCHPGAIDFPKD